MASRCVGRPRAQLESGPHSCLRGNQREVHAAVKTSTAQINKIIVKTDKQAAKEENQLHQSLHETVTRPKPKLQKTKWKMKAKNA